MEAQNRKNAHSQNDKERGDLRDLIIRAPYDQTYAAV